MNNTNLLIKWIRIHNTLITHEMEYLKQNNYFQKLETNMVLNIEIRDEPWNE